MRNLTLLSVVVPCFNEEAVIRATHEKLSSVLLAEGFPIEILYVNDGSRDATVDLLQEISARDPFVSVIDLSRNFGHQMAVTAGLEHARGNAVVIIDADLQDPPEVIVGMVERWRAGIDIVYGQRRERVGETLFKKVTAKAFYRIINYLGEVSIPLDTGDFRLIDRKVVRALASMPESDRFLRGMIPWIGFRQEPIGYDRAERHAGATKYPLRKMLHLAGDGLISFSVKPLRVSIWIGLMISLLSALAILGLVVNRLVTDNWVPGWTFLAVLVLFMGGAQILTIGIVGEYVGRIYREAKRRPLYIVAQRIRGGKAEDAPDA